MTSIAPNPAPTAVPLGHPAGDALGAGADARPGGVVSAPVRTVGAAGGVPALGALERRVMDVLWDCPDQLCARRVLDRLTATELAYTTVATVLTNLTRKGLAERVPGARRWNYRPALSREEYAVACVEQALGSAGDRAAALRLLAERLPAGEREALRAALA
jgi:predicted transcriptional regulator